MVPGTTSTQDACVISELAIKGFSFFPYTRINHGLFDLAYLPVQYIRASYQKHTVNILLKRFFKYTPLTCALSEIWEYFFLFIQVTKEPKAYQGFLEKREKQVCYASFSAECSSLMGLWFQGWFVWSFIKFWGPWKNLRIDETNRKRLKKFCLAKWRLGQEHDWCLWIYQHTQNMEKSYLN